MKCSVAIADIRKNRKQISSLWFEEGRKCKNEENMKEH